MKKRSSLRDQMSKNIDRHDKAQHSYGHILLPKGVSIFSPEPTDRVRFDIMMYEVTDPKHMDRDDNEPVVAVPGSLWWKHPYRIHRNIGVENETVICLTSVGKKCPICEFRAKRIKEGAEKEEKDALRPSLRNLYVIIPIGHKKFKEEPHIFDISQYNFQDLLNEECKENEENKIFPDLSEGKTLKVRFEEKTIGKGQPFPEASRIDFLEREAQYGEEALEGIPKLDECLKVLSYAELEAKLLEVEGEDDGGELKKVSSKKVVKRDEEEEEEEAPAPKKTLTRTPVAQKPVTRKPVEEEEEEEEEAPAPKKKVKPVVEEEEEEEAPPKKVAKPTGAKNKCPHGHKFGVDTEDFDECDDCEIWKECLDAKRAK